MIIWQEKLKELFRLGAIDQRTYLEYSEFGDIDAIIKRTRDEVILQARTGQPSQALGREYGIEMDDESLALSENELMLEGEDQPVEPDDDHDVHLAVHQEHGKNDLVRAHMNEHVNWQRWRQNISARPEPTAPADQIEPFLMGPQIGPGAPPLQGGRGGTPGVPPELV